MSPLLLKLGAGALIAASLLTIGYLKGRSDIAAKWEADKAVWQKDHDDQVAETKRVQAKWDKATRSSHELQEQLAAASDRGASLADRLRRHEARACLSAVPSATTPAAGALDPGPESDLDGRIRATARRVGADCAADAKQLNDVLAIYEGLRAAQ